MLGGERIRLTGHDAPEVFDPDCPDEAELGRYAAESLEGMLRGAGEMELTLEPGRDADGRGLGSIAVDGQDVGERLVMQRLARPEEGGPVPGGEWCR